MCINNGPYEYCLYVAVSNWIAENRYIEGYKEMGGKTFIYKIEFVYLPTHSATSRMWRKVSI